MILRIVLLIVQNSKTIIRLIHVKYTCSIDIDKPNMRKIKFHSLAVLQYVIYNVMFINEIKTCIHGLRTLN